MNVRSRAALDSDVRTHSRAPRPSSAAQSLTATPIAPKIAATQLEKPQVGPTVAALTVGVRNVVPAMTEAPRSGSAGLGQNEALMIVGGAAILVGAVVGGDAGDIFMIGGAIVGLYGLYKYLQ